MQNKVTWDDVYLDFKARHPSLAKRARHYQPYNHATIIIRFEDNITMTYDYLMKQCRVVNS